MAVAISPITDWECRKAFADWKATRWPSKNRKMLNSRKYINRALPSARRRKIRLPLSFYLFSVIDYTSKMSWMDVDGT